MASLLGFRTRLLSNPRKRRKHRHRVDVSNIRGFFWGGYFLGGVSGSRLRSESAMPPPPNREVGVVVEGFRTAAAAHICACLLISFFHLNPKRCAKGRGRWVGTEGRWRGGARDSFNYFLFTYLRGRDDGCGRHSFTPSTLTHYMAVSLPPSPPLSTPPPPPPYPPTITAMHIDQSDWANKVTWTQIKVSVIEPARVTGCFFFF